MAPGAPAAKHPSFFAGALALLDGARFIARTPRAWPMAAVPALIALLVASVLIWLSFDRTGPWLSDTLIPAAESWYARGAKSAIRWLGSLAAAYLSLLFALLVTPPLSAPALERLIRLQERELGASPRPSRGFWFELRCELEAQLAALGIAAPIGLALWLLGVLAPPLWPLVALLQGLLVSLVVAWNLLGYPLTLQGISARERISLMSRNASAVFGFGAAFAAISLIPGAALVLLPVGVTGATRLCHVMTARH